MKVDRGLGFESMMYSVIIKVDGEIIVGEIFKNKIAAFEYMGRAVKGYIISTIDGGFNNVEISIAYDAKVLVKVYVKDYR
jgi:hypothetical protein